MTKRYSVPKNRYLAICLVNVPYPAEQAVRDKAKEAAALSALAVLGDPCTIYYRI